MLVLPSEDAQVPESLPMPRAVRDPKKYKAFISYSHSADLRLSAAVQSGLHRFAKPWYRLRAMRVFRDRTNLSVTPALWPSIEQALSDAEYFLLMASSKAAGSPWVKREVQKWLEESSPDRIFLILTEGLVQWDAETGDFDWTVTTALPDTLRGVFQEEPGWIDLRWAQAEEDLSLSHPQFRDSVAELAAPLHGVEKDEIIGEDVRQHRKTLAVAWTAGILLFFLTLTAAGMAFYASRQRDLAEMQTLMERGARAAIMAQQPGREVESLRLAVQAAQGSLDAGKDIPPEVFAGLASAVMRARYLVPLRGHSRAIVSMHFSPRGDRVLSASEDGTARLWNAATGAPLLVLHHGGAMRAAIFSGDAGAVTAGDDATARIWDLRTGKARAVLRGHKGPVLDIALSPDNRVLLTMSEDGTGRIWDMRTGTLVRELRGHTDKVVSGSFAHRAPRVVTAGWDNTARVWDPSNGHLLVTLPHDYAVRSALFSKDDSRVLTADWGQQAHLWQTGTGRLLTTLTGHEGPVMSARFSPDETRIVTASYDGTIRLWDTATGRQLGLLRGHSGSIESAGFSPDGSRIVSAGWDRTARIWNPRTGRPIALLAGSLRRVRWASFSLDGTRVVTAGDDSVARIWDARGSDSITALYQNAGKYHCLAGRPGGLRIVSDGFGRGLRILDGRNQTVVAFQRKSEEVIERASFANDAATIAIGDRAGVVEVYAVRTGARLQAIQAHPESVRSVALSTHGEKLLSAGEDGTARVWDSKGKLLAELRGHVGPVVASAFLPGDERIITGGADGTARIWNVRTGEMIFILRGHAGAIHAVAVSEDGTRIATTGLDQTAALWDGSTGRRLATLHGHESDVTAAAFSPDGTNLATTSVDDSVRLWDVRSGKPLAVFQGEMSDFSPDLRVAVLWFSSSGDDVTGVAVNCTARVYPTRFRYFFNRAAGSLRNHP
jgi:WD40 repeat protein